MPKKNQPMKDLPAHHTEDVKGGSDPLHLLAQVNHLAAQDAGSSVKQVAASQRKLIK